MALRPTHLFLDFFGTIVGYAPGHADARSTHALLLAMGGAGSYDRFLGSWDASWSAFERQAAADCREFSMTDVAAPYLAAELGRECAPGQVDLFVQTYIAEWNAAVVYPTGIADVVRELASGYELVVVSNTHEPDLVPAHLSAMGIDDCFAHVVTSVEVGWRKPHPAIYAEALQRSGADAERTVFVGDTLLADYEGPVAAGLSGVLLKGEAVANVPDEHRIADLAALPRHLASRFGV